MIVKVIDEVKNYEEAIKLSCDELVKNGSMRGSDVMTQY